MTIYSRIVGTGSYLPSKVLTNRDLERMVETTDQWIYTRTGIRQRHVAADGENASDLALAASRRAGTAKPGAGPGFGTAVSNRSAHVLSSGC